VPSIQIKNVPSDVHRVLRQRAAVAGQSLQEYLLARLTQQAREETLDEVLDRAGGRAGGSVGLGFAVETLRAERKRAA
jgi:plasmid stability protein